ncbi:MAG TPA: hypothetical protein VJZ31_02800 [Bacilli bacterium]|nr:hypothetical protein [Bacilli bacterium]
MYDFYGYLVLALFFIILMVITVLTRNHLIDKDYKTRYAPLLVVGFLIIVLDTSKQLRGIMVGYDKTIIPLYFCSFFNLLYPLAAFSKGRLKQVSQVMASVYSFMVAMGLYLFPTMMIGDSAYTLFNGFLKFHTFFYHHLVILYAMFSISLQLVDLDTKDDLPALLGGAGFYSLIGGIAAAALKVNFHNFYPTNPGFFFDLRRNLGTFFYVLLWGTMFVVVVVPSFFIFKLVYEFIGDRRIPEQTSLYDRPLK